MFMKISLHRADEDNDVSMEHGNNHGTDLRLSLFFFFFRKEDFRNE